MNKQADSIFMRRCFELAKEYIGQVSPNPLVGSVIVKDNEVISQGAHKKAGSAHAELDVINNAKGSLVGTTLYCNLEPCCHTNKQTPPCAQRIIKEGISKVIICNLDPNPLVAGKGVKLLKEAGVEVIIGVLKEEGHELNKIFFTNMTKKRPYIHLKWAQTLDGKLATHKGDSKWISNEASRKNVHQERSQYDSILIGSNTAVKDNPSLTIRMLNKPVKAIKRIILTSKELDPKLNLLSDEYKDQTIKKSGSLSNILKDLYENNKVTSIYVEGGSKIHSNFIKEDLFDEISIYIAPKILGSGKELTLPPIDLMKDAKMLENIKIKQIEDNIFINARRSLCLLD